MSDSAILRVAREAAGAAGEVLTRHFRHGVVARQKEVANLVTDADLEAEAAVLEILRGSFPGHAILAEESAAEAQHAGAEHLWVVDPLDGTNNFAHGIDHFAVSIAYFREGRAECGIVFSPIRGEWFVAERGEGATLDGRPIRVSEEPGLEDAMVGVGFYYDRGAMMESTLRACSEVIRAGTHGIRRFGTAALDLCMVARGQFAAFFEYELSPWDFAAGQLIVEEAGGRVTTCRGEPLALVRSTMLATNGLVHERMLEIVGRHHP